jgi:hypothetical protein
MGKAVGSHVFILVLVIMLITIEMGSADLLLCDGISGVFVARIVGCSMR